MFDIPKMMDQMGQMQKTGASLDQRLERFNYLLSELVLEARMANVIQYDIVNRMRGYHEDHPMDLDELRRVEREDLYPHE